MRNKNLEENRMGFRKTGRVVQKDHHIEEQFCDVCGATIPEDQYPVIQIEVEWCEYRHDGDQADRLDVCSPKCMKIHAEKLVKKWPS